MFKVGDYVICGNKGVCSVENITTLSISGVDKERMYYILKPLYMNGSTVYVPVDSAGESMRKVLEREEAQRLRLTGQPVSHGYIDQPGLCVWLLQGDGTVHSVCAS